MTTVAGIMDFSYNFVDASSHNNGNVQTIANNGDWHRWQSFTYDSLNRITTAQTNADNQPAFSGDNSLAFCWAESYTYDPWGNILTLGPDAATQPKYVGCTQESGFNYTGAIGANNRISETGFTYDAAGNMTASPGPATYVYDAENHLTSAVTPFGSATYTYDGDGKRVMKSNGTIYWYGAGSNAILETDLSANLKYQYFFFNGQRVGRSDGSNSVTCYFADHLGSSRIVWSTAGNDNSDFYPFGGERVISSGTANTYKFTGKVWDTESGNDCFGARYYSSSMGRYMSPDWSKNPTGVPYADLHNPQTLNLYSYVQNNPLSSFDDDGHATIEVKYNPTALGSNHSFIVITDRDGTQTVFRAGPSATVSNLWITPTTGGAASQSSTPGSSQSNSSNSSSPGAGPTAQGNPWVNSTLSRKVLRTLTVTTCPR